MCAPPLPTSWPRGRSELSMVSVFTAKIQSVAMWGTDRANVGQYPKQLVKGSPLPGLASPKVAEILTGSCIPRNWLNESPNTDRSGGLTRCMTERSPNAGMWAPQGIARSVKSLTQSRRRGVRSGALALSAGWDNACRSAGVQSPEATQSSAP